MVSSSENVTLISTNLAENTNEILFQIFYPDKNIYSDVTGEFPVQSDRDNNFILMAYYYNYNNILTTPLKNISGTYIINGIKKFMKIEKIGDKHQGYTSWTTNY